MAKLTLALTLIAGCLSGCASDVTTYDGNGHLIGECKASGGWIIGGGATCAGLANGQSGGTATPQAAPASK